MNAFVFGLEDYVSESNFNFGIFFIISFFLFLIIITLNFGWFLDTLGADARPVILPDTSSPVHVQYAREVVFVMNYLTGLCNCIWYEA